MEKKFVKKIDNLGIALDLKRRIVGVNFLFIKKEFDDCKAERMKGHAPYCRMTAKAMNGEHFKVDIENFTCSGGVEMLGLRPSHGYEKSGKQFDIFCLYEDLAVARKVHNNLLPIPHKIYGAEIGPLSELEKADSVLLLCNGWQAMRIVQGYTYHYGTATNIGMVGNQGICSDLTSRPYMTNDINVSMLCLGARLSTNADDGELGIGMPFNVFRMTMDGVLNTINAATEGRRKKELIERIDSAGCDFGQEVEFGSNYVSYKGKFPLEDYE